MISIFGNHIGGRNGCYLPPDGTYMFCHKMLQEYLTNTSKRDCMAIIFILVLFAQIFLYAGARFACWYFDCCCDLVKMLIKIVAICVFSSFYNCLMMPLTTSFVGF